MGGGCYIRPEVRPQTSPSRVGCCVSGWARSSAIAPLLGGGTGLSKGLEEFCASICDALKEPSFEMIQKIVRLVIDRILARDDRLVIKHIVPAMPFRLRPGSTWPTCPPASVTTRIWRLKPQRLSFVLCPYR